MTVVANVYAQSLPTLNGRVRAYIDHLDENGQIDRDDNMDPVVIRVERVEPNNWRVFFKRNGYEENFLMNPRKRANEGGIVEPIRVTWNAEDGFRRPDPVRRKLDQEPNPRGERARRYMAMVESILGE